MNRKLLLTVSLSQKKLNGLEAVGDFYSEESFSRARRILDAVAKLREDESAIDEVYRHDPRVSRELLAGIREAYRDLGTGAPGLGVNQRRGHPSQLYLSLGVFDEEFFLQGAPLAYLIKDLCYQLDGTTTWAELILPRE